MDPIGFEIAFVKHGHTGGEGGAVGVDEAAAVAGDTGRVGDDEVGGTTSDFEVASKRLGSLALTSLRMTRAGGQGKNGLPGTQPPSWVETASRALLSMAPCRGTSNWL